ncbi:hypothetical protein Dda_5460 [Drechslerella dactyloides]|uniref:Uncharacterized protein n=1 Tax=Drechslerella dactyloides TaxID=74499 RepID=A0AAD6IW47_DREDA|nr:hypothetical protein Dda_5460 [Drechslerella dactyloides]
MEEQGLRDKDRWTTWEIRGMFHAPDRETFPKFTGFIRHVALDACMLYTLDTGFMADESPRGFLMLEPCSEVQEAYKKMTWTALDDANQRFLNTIQVPLGTETSDPNSKPWMRWVSPASEDNTMLLDADTGDTKDMIDLKDNTRTLLSKATVCGGYMAMGQPGDGVWSLLADTELKEGEPWQWGCGSRTVEFDPSFFLDKF